MKVYLYLLCGLLVFTSCEKTINTTPAVQTPKLVVDGTIETGQAPIIVLTKSLGYFSSISPAQLQNSFVRNAVVEISDGTVTHRLKEYTISLAPGAFFYYYSNDATNPATAIIGKNNTRYQLRIVENGEVYTSSTFIPSDNGRKLDSIWWQKAPNNTDTNRCIIMAKISDPPGLGNYTDILQELTAVLFYREGIRYTMIKLQMVPLLLCS